MTPRLTRIQTEESSVLKSLSQKILAVKTPLQLAGVVVVAASAICFRFVPAGLEKGVIATGAVGGFFLAFGLVIARIDAFPPRSRVKLVLTLFAMFLVLVFGCLALAASYFFAVANRPSIPSAQAAPTGDESHSPEIVETLPTAIEQTIAPTLDPPEPSGEKIGSGKALSLGAGAFMVDDLEAGPSPRAPQRGPCETFLFDGQKPFRNQGQLECDQLGVNSRSCQNFEFCDGQNHAGICPVYIDQHQGAWRGQHSLRVFYNVEGAPNGFAGITFGISNTQEVASCRLSREPINLTGFDYLSMHVRPGDDRGNAEVALQDVHSGLNEIVMTNPKVVLVSANGSHYKYNPSLISHLLPRDQWTEIQIPVCDLIRRNSVDGRIAQLDRSAITKVEIAFAKNRFIAEGTDLPGTRQLDIDDMRFLPCPRTGCLPCS